MAGTSIHLIGGGWTPAAFPLTYGPFAEAASKNGSSTIACILLDEPDRDAYFGRSREAFNAVGVTDIYPVFVSPERPLTRGDVEGATGIFIGGGHTPGYHDAIVPSASGWLKGLVRSGIPYGGFSAGAMIAPDLGIIGGWKMRHGTSEIEICSEDVAEDVDQLDIRPGLGLVPFAIDVHASQYGTPTRLLHAVNSHHVAEGWAVDEDTALIARDGDVTVSGRGVAYHVIRIEGRLVVDIHAARS